MSNNSYYNDQWRIINESNQNKVSNYCMEFGGSNIISVSPEVDLGINSTVSIWVNRSVNSNIVLIGNSLVSNYLLYIEPTTIYVRINTIFKTFTNSMVLNQWYNIILVRNGDSIEVFQNGNSIGTQSGYGTTFTTKISTIGAKPAGAFSFVGLADQVTFFDYALSASQVATLYGGGTAITNPMSLSPAPIYYAQLGDQSVDNGANYLVPNNSLSDYVFNFITPNSQSVLTSGFTVGNIYTFSCWLKSNTVSPSAMVFLSSPNYFTLGSNGNFVLRFSNSTTIQLVTYNGKADLEVASGAIPAIDTNWHNIVITTNGTTFNMYWDSLPITVTGTSTKSLSDIINGLRIGGGHTSLANWLNGQMSNVSFWNSYLTSAQIETIYNNGAPNDISSLSPVSWWKLNAADTFDGTNWTIKDYAGSNDGTSSGMTSSNLVVSDLQQTSGYSPYALDFGGITEYLKTATIPAATNTVTLSAWVKRTGNAGSYGGVFGVRNAGGAPAAGISWNLTFLSTTNKIQMRIAEAVGFTYKTVTQDTAMIDNTWTHVVGVADGTNVYLYINGVLQSDTTTYNGNLLAPTSNIFFAAQGYAGSNPFNGQLSNCARWNIGLTQAQITEIYNQGVPSNLNTFSGTAPIGWWQLGSNSSFETVGMNSFWRCLDEIGTDYATSFGTGMTNGDITNGPGYSANGLGTSSIEIKGNAPYSTANGLSENMDVLDRVKDVAPFVVIDDSLQFTVQMGAGETFVFPGTGSGVFRIDWGQGAGFQDVTGANNTSPAYATAGTYTIRIGETVGGVYKGATIINFNGSTTANKAKIRELQNWGKSTWATLTNSFRNIPNLTITATDYPDLSIATKIHYAFYVSPFPGSTNFTGWDVSNIENFSYMFYDSVPSGSIDLSNWDMSSATTINSMISGVDGSVGDITGWDVSNVTGIGFQSFMNASTSFNQDISSWDISKATNLGNFLRSFAFNQNMGALSLPNGLTSMSYMCYANGMSTENYTDTFVGFANQVKTNGFPYNVNAANQAGRTYDNARSGGSNFANAAAARTFLTSTVASGGAGWTISSDTIIN